jgi:hypothetical protein
MSQKVSKEYKCEACDYVTCKKSDYTKHLLTRKHTLQINTNGNSLNIRDFKCECGKIYKHQSSLWNHKKKCTFIEEEKEKVEVNNPEVEAAKKLVQAEEKNDQLMNVLTNMTQSIKNLESKFVNQPPQTTNNIVNNFNLNVYLNETCKDALNLTDFVDSIQLQLKDLENMGKMGYVDGMSNLIITELNNLEKEKRPIHCSDLKRDILYIKDNDVWEKDNSKVQDAVVKLEKKNFKQMPAWLEENPQAKCPTSEKSTTFHDILQGSFSQQEEKKIKKVLKNIAKATPVRENNSKIE